MLGEDGASAVIDVLRRRAEELADLFGRERMRRVVARIGREQAAVDQVPAVRDQQQRRCPPARPVASEEQLVEEIATQARPPWFVQPFWIVVDVLLLDEGAVAIA